MAKVLIVDDSPTEVHIMQNFLKKMGHDVVIATSGEEGINLAETTAPNLILMDVVMPGMNGFQATRHLSKNARTASIPVIMVTTKDQETDKVWGMRQGAKDYLVKPIKEEEFVAHITSLLT